MKKRTNKVRVTLSDQERGEIEALSKHLRVSISMALRMAIAAEYKRQLGRAA